MVSNGSAHHTRREVSSETGGGGGRGTLEPAVTRSLLLMASMTVTEVTTRIAVVGVVSFAGLLFLHRFSAHESRAINDRSRHSFDIALRSESLEPEDGVPSARLRAAAFASLLLAGAVSGLAIGLVVSLLLLVSLNAVDIGAAQ